MATSKPVVFLGDSLERLRGFPDDARHLAGQELRRVQLRLEPLNWKPMTSIGAGVREIRVREAAGAFRVIYVAKLADAIYVLHAFAKKTGATAQKDIELASARMRLIRAR